MLAKTAPRLQSRANNGCIPFRFTKESKDGAIHRTDQSHSLLGLPRGRTHRLSFSSSYYQLHVLQKTSPEVKRRNEAKRVWMPPTGASLLQENARLIVPHSHAQQCGQAVMSHLSYKSAAPDFSLSPNTKNLLRGRLCLDDQNLFRELETRISSRVGLFYYRASGR